MMRDESVGLPFLNGVYIAVDAVPDCLLVVDGPYCVVHKAALHASHHLASDLFSPFSNGRVIPTHREASIEEVASVALDRDLILKQALEGTYKLAHPGFMLATSFDYVELVQRPLHRIVEALKSQGIPVAKLEGSSLSNDWVQGYVSVLEALALELPLPSPEPQPHTVGIVGYFFDRNEGDHQGNLAELERVLGALSVKVGAVWLSGTDTPALAQIARCDGILALPHAGSAASCLSKRLGIPVCQVPLPFGLEATADFLRRTGEFVGCPEKAEALIAAEVTSVLQKSAGIVQQFLSTASASIVLEPVLARATAAFCEELGMHVTQCSGVGLDVTPLRMDPDLADAAPLPPPPHSAPTEAARLRRHLCIASSIHQQFQPGDISFQFGYPDMVHHYLNQHPFLGFSGALNWVSGLCQAVLEAELRELKSPL